MENKRLIPYSVHLSEEVYLALKEHAKGRKASAIVRDAITMILEGDDAFTSGYNNGLRDAMNTVHKDEVASTISVNERRVADRLIDQIEQLIR
jgi:predicted transcriptional regulator